jgi:hypothetical protein
MAGTSGTLTLQTGWNETLTVTGVDEVWVEGEDVLTAELVSVGGGVQHRTRLNTIFGWHFIKADEDGQGIYQGGLGYPERFWKG